MNILEIDMISPLCFYRLEKGLCYSVVPTIAFATHTLNEIVFLKCFSEFIASILNALVRVDNQTFTWFSSPERLVEGLKNHLLTQRGADSPPGDNSRKEVDKDRQIHPAGLCYR